MIKPVQKSYCPYCSNELDNPPRRKRNCPNCGKPIYVRKGQLVTEEDSYIRDEIVRLESFGINRQAFDEHRKILTKKFGSTATPNDTFWHIFNTQLIENRDSHNQMMIYYEMARLVYKENRDPTPYIKQALIINLNVLKAQGVKWVRIAGYGMQPDNISCPNCQSLHGKKFPIDIAIKEMPIPTLCSNEMGCKCSYISEAEWKICFPGST
jgi:hypothetical protein